MNRKINEINGYIEYVKILKEIKENIIKIDVSNNMLYEHEIKRLKNILDKEQIKIEKRINMLCEVK